MPAPWDTYGGLGGDSDIKSGQDKRHDWRAWRSRMCAGPLSARFDIVSQLTSGSEHIIQNPRRPGLRPVAPRGLHFGSQTMPPSAKSETDDAKIRCV